MLLVLDPFADQPCRLSDHHDDHDCKHNLMYVDLISHDMISRDRNEYAKNSESVVSSLSWRGLEAEQLMEQCTNSEEHGKIVTLITVSRTPNVLHGGQGRI